MIMNIRIYIITGAVSFAGTDTDIRRRRLC